MQNDEITMILDSCECWNVDHRKKAETQAFNKVFRLRGKSSESTKRYHYRADFHGISVLGPASTLLVIFFDVYDLLTLRHPP